MKTVALERSGTTRLFWLIAAILVALMVVTFKQTDPGIAAAGIVLALASLLPLYVWLLGWSHGLPLWPVFSLITGVTFAMALVQDPRTLDTYTPGEVITGAMTMCGFVLLGTLFWLSFTARAPKAPGKLFMIQGEHAVQYLYGFIWIGVFFLVNGFIGLIHLPGNTMQVARGVALALNAMGIFALTYYHGRGLLSKSQVVWLIIGIVLTVALSLTSLMLATAIVPVALGVFGFMLGSNRIPWNALALVMICLALLHPGKWEMRDKYWGSRGTESITLAKLPGFFSEWLGYGMTHIGGLTGVLKTQIGEEDEGRTSAFERAGNAHMLLLVQKKSPQEVPFMNGLTYEPIPRLLIPRFIDSEKGISHSGNIILNVNYGLMTLEATANVSIYWGLVPEAYANFGYLGVAALAFFLAGFYSFFTRLSVGVPMTSLRFVLGLMVMAASTKADTMGIFITTQFQSMAGVTIAALFLMRRLPNPFAGAVDVVESGFGTWRDRFLLPKQFAPAGAEAAGGEWAMPDGSLSGQADLAVSPAVPRTPMRATAWMPRSLRSRIVAGQRAEAALAAQATRVDPEATKENGANQRPRQVAVPYRNYRRYRG
jgi:hypothetical protein